MSRLKIKQIWLTLLFLAMALRPAIGAEVTPDEVKASYLIKMRPFIMVGTPPHMIQKICYYEKPDIVWNESVGQIIAKYVEQNPDRNTNPLTVQWFKAIRDFSGCDLFYIPADEAGNIDNILSALDSGSTLTISDAPQFIFKGGMIGFVLDDSNHVRMVSNLKNTKAKNVHLDAQLLEIMQHVENQ